VEPKIVDPAIKDDVNIRASVLAQLCHRFELTKLCEVGVKSGGLTAKLASLLPDATIVGVDPWRFYPDWPSWDNAKHLRHEEAFDRVMARYPKRIFKMKMSSLEAAAKIADDSLDLVFLDGDHSYSSVRADIDAWLPKVRKGGVLSGHDYNNTAKYGDYFKGVDRAVDEAFPKANIEPDYVWWTRVYRLREYGND
jgi:predicted O-methyltransferase YrrM